MSSPKSTFTTREWFGVTVGIAWGLVLSRFFVSQDMAGPWLVVLFGPPLVLLISPSRPILSWQLPVITASLTGTWLYRGPEESLSDALLAGTVCWLMCSVFSSPWALIFYRRLRRNGLQPTTSRSAAAQIGVGFLAFLSCALVILGFAAIVYPGGPDPVFQQEFTLCGLGMTTLAAGLCILTYKLSRNLQVDAAVGAVLELILLLPSTFGVIGIVASLFIAHSGQQGDAGSSYVEVCFVLSTLEMLGTLIWLDRVIRRAQHSERAPIQS